MRLSSMRVNQEGIVISVDIPDRVLKRHLLEMGLTRGTRIKVLNVAPMGDPISINLRGYELAVRKSEAMRILVEVMS